VRSYAPLAVPAGAVTVQEVVSFLPVDRAAVLVGEVALTRQP
jgi:hypothetical protein